MSTMVRGLEFDPTQMTDRQEAYIRGLLDERDLPPDAREAALRMIEPPLTIGKIQASHWIQRLQEYPVKPSDKAALVQYINRTDDPIAKYPVWTGGKNPVPKGTYCIDTKSKNANNQVAFYELWMGDCGSKWEGAYVVRQHIGPSDERMTRNAANAILKKIAEDPAAAAARYGHLIGECGICHRRLTNDESRARGIGPICAQAWGW